MKTFSKIAVVLLMLVMLIGTATACNTVDEIYVEKGNTPNLVVIQGEELDLSSGKLTVVQKEETELIDFNASGVTVEGFDTNKLGRQVLTIGYMGKTTTLTITVVARITAENIDVNYFVGEPFNSEKGELRITNDNGSTFNVPINDEAVTIKNYDSSAPASPLNLTVEYKVDENTTYTGIIAVNIYSVETVDFTKPNKISYKSHETSIDLAGGYITYKGNSGALTRFVALTEDMISGFDPSVATEDNRVTPYTQTITVNYANESYTFDLSIIYSEVSNLKKLAAELESIDWTQTEIPAISEAQGEAAMQAITTFNTMPNEDKVCLSVEEQATFARVAAVYGLQKWNEAALAFQDTFVLNAGQVSLVCDSYEQTKTDYEKLLNAEDPFIQLSNFLVSLGQNFKNIPLMGETYIGDYLDEVIDSVDLAEITQTLNFMITMYDKLAVIPENWTVQSLAAHNELLAETVAAITSSSYAADGQRTLFARLSAWRANDDYFDIIYRYYFSQNDGATILSLKDIYLPGRLEDVYSYMMTALGQIMGMSQGRVPDTTTFMVTFTNAVRAANEIIAGTDEMERTLFVNLTFSGILVDSNQQPVEASFSDIISVLQSTSYGYFYHNGSMYADPTFTALWNLYSDFINNIMNDADYFESTEYNRDVVNVFTAFVNMSPIWQYGFLTSVNTYYPNAPERVLDFNGPNYTYFSAFISSYYRSILSETAVVVFNELVLAIENYSLYHASGMTAEFLSAFCTNVENVVAGYRRLSTEDKAAFDQNVGFIYEKYLEIYNRYEDIDNPKKTDLGEWADEFSELSTAINQLYDACYIVHGMGLSSLTSAILATYERVELLAKNIIENAPAEIVKAYYYEVNAAIGTTNVTMDYAVFSLRQYYISIVRSSWGAYSNPDLRNFFADAAYVMYGCINKIFLDPDSTDNFADAAKVKAAMASFRKLTAEYQYVVLFSLDRATVYYSGLMSMFDEQLTDAAAALALKLLNFERAYVLYQSNPEGFFTNQDGTTISFLNSLKATMAELKADYAALAEADKTSFNKYMAEMYEYYIAEYDKLITSLEK